MKPQIRTIRGAIGNEIYARIPNMNAYPKTTLQADAASGASAVVATDAQYAQSGAYVVLGDPGTDQCEIVKLGSPSGTTLALSGTTLYAHERGTRLTYIPYNQVVLQRSTDGTTYNDLVTASLQIYNVEHYYNDVDGLSTYYYRCKFKNQTTGYSTDTSDAVVATGYADNTVFSIKERALLDMGMQIYDIYRPGAIVTDEYLNKKLWELRRTVDNMATRWSFRKSLEYSLGHVTAGKNYITLPTTLRGQYTAQNIKSIRIGQHRPEMFPISKHEWNALQLNRKHTTLVGSITTSDVIATLTDSGDFDESGSISIFADGTEDTISYTTNTESTGVLEGVTDITASHTAGDDVWQNAGAALPRYYTIFNGRIYFDCPVGTDYHNEDLMIDMWNTITAIDSDSDTFDEPEYDYYVSGLKWAIRGAQQQGVLPPMDTDADYQSFIKGVSAMLAKERDDDPIQFIPVLPNVSK